MERWTNNVIESDYGRVVTTYSSNEIFDELDHTPDLRKVIKRLEALNTMVTDMDASGDFDEAENGIIKRGGKEKLLYETLRDIQALALVLVDETKRLNDDYDGTLCIFQGMKEERSGFCDAIDRLTEENDRLIGENKKYKATIEAINEYIDGYKAKFNK